MVNLGGAPHDSDDIQDFWYALQQLGLTDGDAENPHIGIDKIDAGLHRYSIRSDNDTFNSLVSMPRINLFTAKFYQADAPELNGVYVTETGSAGTSNSGGTGKFFSGTDPNAKLLIKSGKDIIYSPGREIYLLFTASWEQPPTSDGDKAEVGLYDDGDGIGYTLGYNGTEFGITHYNNGGEVEFVPQSSFNEDTLVGAEGSEFTREDSPESLNTGFLNVFRMRFGWLGSATLHVEVLAPDGNWVLIHTIRNPNSSLSPKISEPNLPASINIEKNSSDSTDIRMESGSWAGGVVAQSSVARQPDGDLVEQRANGQATYTDDILISNGEYVSEWVDTDGWGAIELDIRSDQPSVEEGVVLEFTGDTNVNNPNVVSTTTFTYTQEAVNSNTALHAVIPTQLDGFRVRYINGDIGQNSFTFVTTLIRESQRQNSRVNAPIDNSSLATTSRSIVMAPNDNDEFEYVKRSQLNGLRTSVVEHETDTPIRPDSNLNTVQRQIPDEDAGGPVQVADNTLVPRSEVRIHNHGDSPVFLGSTNTVSVNNGFIIHPANTEVFSLSEAEDLWIIAQDGTGSSTTHTLDPTAAGTGGTATNPDNVVASDDTRAIYDSQDEDVSASGYDASSQQVADDITAVSIGMEGRKDGNPGTQTVSFEENASNAQINGTSITTNTSLSSNSEHSYYAFVSVRPNTAGVDSVSGLGMDWVNIAVQTNASGVKTSVWRATGTPVSSGAVTANFDQEVNSCAIDASRWSGVGGVESTGVNSSTNNPWSVSVSDSTVSGRVVGASTIPIVTTNDPGSDDTEHSEQTVDGANNERLTLAVQSRESTGSNVTTDGTWGSGGTGWAAVAISLTPETLDDPEMFVEYEVGSEGTGETSLTQVLDVSTDQTYMEDITPDRDWTYTDIDNTTLTATLQNTNSENAEIDHLFIEFTEVDSGSTQRVTIAETGP